MLLQRVEVVLNPAASAAVQNHPVALVLQSLRQEALNPEASVLQNLLEAQAQVANPQEVQAQVLAVNHLLEVLNPAASVHRRPFLEAQALQEAVQIILLREATAQAAQNGAFYLYLYQFHGVVHDITVHPLEAITADQAT